MRPTEGAHVIGGRPNPTLDSTSIRLMVSLKPSVDLLNRRRVPKATDGLIQAKGAADSQTDGEPPHFDGWSLKHTAGAQNNGGLLKTNRGPPVHRIILLFDRGPHEPIKGIFRPTKGFCKTTGGPSDQVRT